MPRQLTFYISEKIHPGEIFDYKFIQGMLDRMATSHFKYGNVSDTYPDKKSAILSLYRRLDMYAETGNTEWLMDVANFAMIEFMRPSHPNKHFRATDSEESPGLEDK